MKKIIHVDMDAFFVSVEIRDQPSLAGKPVAVGGSRVSRGVLSTCNYIAREYGVRSAMPTSLALSKCPELILLPGRMDVYKQVSAQIREIFSRYTSQIEPLSLDEAYLDVSDCKMFKGSATLIAQDICKTIHHELSLTASAGVAPVKFLAKVASDINKPNGMYVINPNEVHTFLENMPLNKIPGVGKVTYEKLQARGFEFGRDIRQANQLALVNEFGKLGTLLWHRCHGIDEREVVTSRLRHSVGVERTFVRDIDNLPALQSILLNTLLPELKLRAAKHLVRRSIHKIGVKVKFNDFQQTTKEFTFNSFNEALFSELLIEAFQRGRGKKVRLLGAQIGLSKEPTQAQQYAFDW